ncbi:hypothetical protein GPECTOR_39g487 [Gonium pectorale]|uniref:F-box domain-containing protein n=1 Tax=Gonium pectorale TaxID=33097 RepID=A0A150GB47_GONPE|nr:hypothetical protein GPECTOR_39g487 [Gonium pectorale]|eukprot:KXZ46993.1 hypothetical protein GPECTOR_39g487 [Gonium pectorale]
MDALPCDVLEHICRFLDAKSVSHLACCSKTLRNVAMARGVWVGLLQRSFSSDELPQELDATCSTLGDASLVRAQVRQLFLQRPAFLSDAPRTCEIMEHTGSRFRKVLHIDGRRDLNFTSVFRSIPPGQYCVVWRVMLQPGYVRGYCNFRPVFGRPASSEPSSKAKARRALAAGSSYDAADQAGGRTRHGRHRRWRFGLLAGKGSEEAGGRTARSDEEFEAAGGGVGGVNLSRTDRAARGVRRRLRWLPGCMSPSAAARADEELPRSAATRAAGGGAAPLAAAAIHADPAPYPHQPEELANGDHPVATAVAGGHPEIEIEPLPAAPPPPALPPAPAQVANPVPAAVRQGTIQRQLATASAKRDAALAAGGGGPRYVPRWLSPLWGSHASSWRQLDPAGPLGHGVWRTLHLGSLTVRRPADVHLHSVMVQLRPQNPDQEQLALPPGESRWRGALVDYVELVPVRRAGLLQGLLPGFAVPAPTVFPELREVVEVPRA